jgi:hypothetical protein
MRRHRRKRPLLLALGMSVLGLIADETHRRFDVG